MADYIKYIRNLVGHAPIICVGTSVIAKNELGSVLFQQRTDNGLYSFPGGMCEMGENTEDTAKRELLEEVGIVADELTLCGVVSGKNNYYQYPNGDEVHNITLVYACNVGPAQAQALSETKAIKWICFDECSTLELSAPTQVMITTLNQEIKNILDNL